MQKIVLLLLEELGQQLVHPKSKSEHRGKALLEFQCAVYRQHLVRKRIHRMELANCICEPTRLAVFWRRSDRGSDHALAQCPK